SAQRPAKPPDEVEEAAEGLVSGDGSWIKVALPQPGNLCAHRPLHNQLPPDFGSYQNQAIGDIDRSSTLHPSSGPASSADLTAHAPHVLPIRSLAVAMVVSGAVVMAMCKPSPRR